MVVGGFVGRNITLQNTLKQTLTEVIDLTDSSLKCTSAFGELESQRIRAMGGIINETPVICGGYKKYKNEGDEDFNYEDHDSCVIFGDSKTFIKMNKKRTSAFSLILNETTLLIMGGADGSTSNFHSSTELITLNAATSVNGPSLPKGLVGSCAVKYNETHIYLTGGQVGITGDNQDNVWIDNNMLESGNSSWKEGPRMNEGRYYHGCIALHYQEKIYIVVAGGRTSRTDTLKSVEILDPNTNKWVPGENSKKYHFGNKSNILRANN